MISRLYVALIVNESRFSADIEGGEQEDKVKKEARLIWYTVPTFRLTQQYQIKTSLIENHVGIFKQLYGGEATSSA